MKASFTSILILFFALSISAQQPFQTIRQVPGMQPEWRSGEVDFTLLGSRNNTPPPAPVRLMAEWEEVQALLVSWENQHSELLREIVRHGSEECKVIVFAQNVSAVSSYLQSGGVPMDNVEVLDAEYDSIWIRDYGPWTVYHNDVDSLMISDYEYNRPWRTRDDKIPAFIADYMGLPVYEADEEPYRWVHAGGNNLRDGMGTIFSSDLVLEENPSLTEAEIDELAHLFMGAERYVKLPNLPYDVISHLDMHMRFIDEETVFIGEYPEGVSDGPQIEANIEYLRNEVPTPFGNTYNILRLPMPPDAQDRYPDQNGDYRTYTNSLIVNGTVLVPVYEEKYDTVALRLYEEAMPGYNIVGIDCNDIIPRLGAIHCITKLVGVADPLWIAHPRLRDTEQLEGEYETFAIIKHRSGIVDAQLHYRTAGEDAYTAVSMALADSAAARWEAAIPAQPENTVVEYYISAEAVNGKQQARPMVAPEGYFRFKVDALRPAFAPVQQTICPEAAITFTHSTAGAYDSLRWHFPGGSPASSVAEAPTVAYAEGGAYAVSLVAYRGTVADTLTVDEAVLVRQAWAPYVEEFAGGFMPEVWEVENPDGDDAAWERVDGDFCNPGAMRIEHFLNNTEGTSDFLRSSFDISGMQEPGLVFSVAYAQKTSSFADGLRVNVIDCAGNRTTVYEKFGQQLATAPSQISPFVPDECEDWREEVVSLEGFSGEVLAVEFESLGDYGNNLYLDLIEVRDLMPVQTQPGLDDYGIEARLFPNPAREQVYVDWVSPDAGQLRWVVRNALGQQLRQGVADYAAGAQQLPIDIRGLAAGSYTVALSAKNGKSVSLLIVE